ncbi:MAG: hypothetical protein A2170_00315 [Deltaproteobacteria bacterium RBG_13_53_10]|nr:MAG: hypothetical protein A2170_00315 [Deltaproteobacteria bacterium RBG_13_53_10]
MGRVIFLVTSSTHLAEGPPTPFHSLQFHFDLGPASDDPVAENRAGGYTCLRKRMPFPASYKK